MEKRQIDPKMSGTIMDQSRNLFVYGYNGAEREEFLKQMVSSYPMDFDQSNPVGIYISEIGMPKTAINTKQLDSVALACYNRDYLKYLIVLNILNNGLSTLDEKKFNNRSKELLEKINKFWVNRKLATITNLREFRDVLSNVMESYRNDYTKYVLNGELINFTRELPIVDLELRMFVRNFKEMLNMNSYFGIVFDHQKPISLGSTQAINERLTSSSNKDMSFKVVSEPDGWDNFSTSGGEIIQSSHDYGIVELDSSYGDYMKKLLEREKHIL